MKHLRGRVVEMGDLPALAGAPGVLIEATREDLAALQYWLLFQSVELVPVPVGDEAEDTRS